MIAPGDAWGPFAPDLDPAESRARLKALRQTARLLAGPRSTVLCQQLAAAETEPAALELVCCALNDMAATDRRGIWASYAALARTAA